MNKKYHITSITLMLASIVCYWITTRISFFILPTLLLFVGAILFLIVSLLKYKYKKKLRYILWVIDVVVFLMVFIMPAIYHLINYLFSKEIVSNDVFALTSIILFVVSLFGALAIFIYRQSDEDKL